MLDFGATFLTDPPYHTCYPVPGRGARSNRYALAMTDSWVWNLINSVAVVGALVVSVVALVRSGSRRGAFT